MLASFTTRSFFLPVVRWWEAGGGGRSLHVAGAGDGVQTGEDSFVTAQLRGLVEGRSHQVVEYLPPELEVVVTVFLTISDPRFPGFVEADEPGLGCSCQDIVSKYQHRDRREPTNKVNDLDLISKISKSRQVRVGGRGNHVVDERNMTGYVLYNFKSEFAFQIRV